MLVGQGDPCPACKSWSHSWHQQVLRDISASLRKKRLDGVLTPFSETPTRHFTIQLCSQIHIPGCIPETCVRHEALSVSPSHNTSGLRRSLTDGDEGGGECGNEKKRLNSKKKKERRKTNQAGKWQELFYTAGMFFICDTAAVSGTKKDRDVQIELQGGEQRKLLV